MVRGGERGDIDRLERFPRSDPVTDPEQKMAPDDAYRSLVKHAPYGILHSTRDGRILSANPAMVRMLGYEREAQLLELDLASDVYADPEERTRVLQADEPGPFEGLETRWLRADGTEVDVRLSGRALFDDDASVAAFETFVEDVTERVRAQAALEESEERYRDLVQHSPDAIVVHDGENIVFANPAAARIFAVDDPDHLVDLPVVQVVSPEHRDVVRERIRNVLATGEPADPVHLPIRRGDGRTAVLEVVGMPVPWQGRTMIQLVARDVTERLRVRQRLDRVLEAGGALLFALVRDGRGFRTLWVSESVRRLLGYSVREAVVPEWFPQGIHPDDRARVLESSRSVLEREKVVQEFRFRHADGDYRWFRQELHRVETAPGSPPEVVGVWIDISDRKEAEVAARESAEHLRSLLNAAPEAILTADRSGRIRNVNPAAEEIFGYEPEELIGRPFTLLFPERFRDENRRVFEELAADDRDTALAPRPMRGLRKCGEEFPAEVSVAEHTAGDDYRVTAIVRDVTRRRRLEAEREALIEELRTALTEVRTLRGILPICSSCKKIRDDTGYWHRVESYVRSHTDAELTHGICPDCSRALYGELDEEL